MELSFTTLSLPLPLSLSLLLVLGSCCLVEIATRACRLILLPSVSLVLSLSLPLSLSCDYLPYHWTCVAAVLVGVLGVRKKRLWGGGEEEEERATKRTTNQPGDQTHTTKCLDERRKSKRTGVVMFSRAPIPNKQLRTILTTSNRPQHKSNERLERDSSGP